MKSEDKETLHQIVSKILETREVYPAGDLLLSVERILAKKESLEVLVKKHNTPFYVYDQNELDASIDQFLSAFRTHIPRFRAYYAIKVNHHPLVVQRAVEKGMGLDVASRRELVCALETGSTDIVYFSPGKAKEDLGFAVEHAEKIRIHLDSFSELKRLGAITNTRRRPIQASVRIHTDTHGLWSKYGIHLKDLKQFWHETKNFPFIQLNGIHFHMSRNRTSDFYTKTIQQLGSYLAQHFSPTDRAEVQFIDFGGGFEPYRREGFYPWETPWGKIIQTAYAASGEPAPFTEKYYLLLSPTIEEYARAIGSAIREHLDPIITPIYQSEPGRYICNSAMHIVLQIVDVKDAENCILNGGGSVGAE